MLASSVAGRAAVTVTALMVLPLLAVGAGQTQTPQSTQTTATAAQTTAAPAPAIPPQERAPTREDILRGEYDRYRSNNDLLFYRLDIRVDPEKKLVSGKNTIRFRMLKDDTRIHLDLYANLQIEKIVMGATALKYDRELRAVFID